jgi:hypothetical protein
VQIPQGDCSFIQATNELESGGSVTVPTTQSDFKEIFTAKPSVKEDELVNVFGQSRFSDERGVQSPDKIWKPLKEETVSLLEVSPLLWESATEFLANRVWH